MVDDKLLDPETEKRIRDRVDSYVAAASKKLDSAKAGTMKAKDDVEDSIRDRPLEWVIGAFVAGFVFGKLSSK